MMVINGDGQLVRHRQEGERPAVSAKTGYVSPFIGDGGPAIGPSGAGHEGSAA